jgi:hypothetical protein
MQNVSVRVSVSGLEDIKHDLEEIERNSQILKELVRELDRKIFKSGIVLEVGEQGTIPEDEIIISHEN